MLDTHHQLKNATGIVGGFKEQAQPAHPFLQYAQEYWLFHIRLLKPARVAGYSLWPSLIDDEIETIELPWISKKRPSWVPKHSLYFDDEYIKYIVQNKHWALINQALVRLSLKDIRESLKDPLRPSLYACSTTQP